MPFRTPIGALVLGCAIVAAVPCAVAAHLAPEQRRAIENVVHDYLLQHPDVLIEALQRAEAKLKSDVGRTTKQALAARQREIFDDPQTPVGGNPQGDVTLVEFFDTVAPIAKRSGLRSRSCAARTRNYASRTRSSRFSGRARRRPPRRRWRRAVKANTRRFTMR
jgi:hypothetical protein